jgi:hypothetical protein
MSSSITLVTADNLQQSAVLGHDLLVHSASVMQVLISDSLRNDRALVTYIIKANGLGNLIRALYWSSICPTLRPELIFLQDSLSYYPDVDVESCVAEVESSCSNYLDVLKTKNAFKAIMQLRDVSQPMYTVLFSKKPEFVFGRHGPCVALNAAQRALKGLEKSDPQKGAFPNPKCRRIETLSTKKYKNIILRQSLVEKVKKFTKLKGTIF